MESKTSSGQILIECALLLIVLAVLFSTLLDFNAHKRGKFSKQKIIKSKQILNFREYRNGDK